MKINKLGETIVLSKYRFDGAEMGTGEMQLFRVTRLQLSIIDNN